MIDLAILGVLKDQDLHGYELRKRLGDLLGSRLAVSFGSVYPTLAKLEKAGFVKAVTSDAGSLPRTPMSGSLAGELAALRANPAALHTPSRGGRGKKVYGITARGDERLHELLVDGDPAGDDASTPRDHGVGAASSDRDFAVRVAFCHHLARPERLGLFQRRRDVLRQRRDQRRQATTAGDEAKGQGPGEVNDYLRSLLEHDTETLSADLTWLDGLIKAERATVKPLNPNTKGQHQR